MSKAILLSIRPQYVAKILNGEKTIEIRKTMPKCDLPIDVYIYCTKDKYVLRGVSSCAYLPHPRMDGKSTIRFDKDFPVLNGKVVAKFTVRKVEKIQQYENEHYCDVYYRTTTLIQNELLSKSSLTPYELSLYLNDKDGYAYHIEDLVVFDKPKELSDFKHICPNIMCDECNYADLSTDKCLPICSNQLKRAPQNFVFVDSEE